MNRAKPPNEKQVYTHFTCATDTQQVKCKYRCIDEGGNLTNYDRLLFVQSFSPPSMTFSSRPTYEILASCRRTTLSYPLMYSVHVIPPISHSFPTFSHTQFLSLSISGIVFRPPFLVYIYHLYQHLSLLPHCPTFIIVWGSLYISWTVLMATRELLLTRTELDHPFSGVELK